MAPPQGETRVGKISIAFVWKHGKLGKWLQSLFSQVQTIAHGKGSNSTNNSSSERRNASSSIETHLPADNPLPASMRTDERGLDLPLQPSQLNPYLNLPPPPPPPPQFTVAPLIRAETPVEQLGQLDEGRRAQEFHDIEKQHDNIMATRDDLAGYRSQMKTDRGKIRQIRDKTGAQEGSVINQLRIFLHQQNITLSREIEETFDQIDSLRDQLGFLEAEYDDFEQDYTMKEVQHTGKEMQFIENLRSAHSRCPAASTLMQTQKNADTGHAASDVTSSEKALQLFVQTKVHPEAQKVDEPQATDIVLFANKTNVDDWLVNTIFQSPPIPQAYVEKSNQDSLMGQALQDWHWLGTIGAQFQDEELDGSSGKSKKKQDSVLSSNAGDEPVLVLHTKEVSAVLDRA